MLRGVPEEGLFPWRWVFTPSDGAGWSWGRSCLGAEGWPGLVAFAEAHVGHGGRVMSPLKDAIGRGDIPAILLDRQ